jgi:TonB-dependent SusC/RagA subfamily outer membrane receptor
MSADGKLAALVVAGALLALAACGGSGARPGEPAPDNVQVGYGTQKEGATTGSITSVSQKDLGGSQPLRLDELLRGRVPGLQITALPEGGYSYRIRGSTVVDGVHPEPLFIVDGTEISPRDLEGALAGLTRDDIKRVDVLKDLSSTSIYGTRGAGGVILITTTRR